LVAGRPTINFFPGTGTFFTESGDASQASFIRKTEKKVYSQHNTLVRKSILSLFFVDVRRHQQHSADI
jgi:hypothetical protein